MRKGPHPLLVHVGMAAANMSGINQYTKQFDKVLSEQDAVEMMRGIQLYQNFNTAQARMPVEKIWEEGGISITKPEGVKHKLKQTVLFIPSLINKSYILDINEKKSFVRWLWKHEVDAYILDWGTLEEEDEKHLSLDDLIQGKLSKAIRFLSEETKSQINLAGYCMGGTMLLGTMPYVSDCVRTVTLIATPWNFKDEKSHLNRAIRIWTPIVQPEMRRKAVLPSHWVQALFASYDPEGAAQKFINFVGMNPDSDQARLFVAVEDWLNDGIDIPLSIAEKCLNDWFIENRTYEGNWSVGNQKVCLEETNVPVHVILSDKDRLVSYNSAQAVQEKIPKELVAQTKLNCGHIGLIVGRNAAKDVWTPFLKWIIEK
ncbi:MAG: hypothetical protein GC137_09135 [Alphaproteobacteria bacterium]|nr:hypothetical protein [Alphaproteobacteria bacterium]